MKETPIIFSTPMVQAILEGRKTQTRRVVKIQPQNIGAVKFTQCWDHSNFDKWLFTSNSGKVGIFKPNWIKCPYGKVGDLLWVRETFYMDWEHDRIFFRADADDDGYLPYLLGGEGGFGGGVADAKIDKWKPSIHMFKKYARIWLEITDIKVERLQDTQISDFYKEGYPHQDSRYWDGARKWFHNLWDSINAKKHPWSSNPWVWCVEFKKR